MIAQRAFNILANGMGGIDWSGLGLAVEWLGVVDVDDLIFRLLVIKGHGGKPPSTE